jgi:ubiquinone/menaquinone biosynthesis C-methylase UbiE
VSQDERWQLSGHAAGYYERYVGLLMEPWVRCFVDVAVIQPAERALDVACGTGFVARLAARCIGAAGRVVGLDLNASMIEAARAASGREGGATIEWQTGDGDQLTLPAGVHVVTADA